MLLSVTELLRKLSPTRYLYSDEGVLLDMVCLLEALVNEWLHVN